jgi:hypothetical protein
MSDLEKQRGAICHAIQALGCCSCTDRFHSLSTARLPQYRSRSSNVKSNRISVVLHLCRAGVVMPCRCCSIPCRPGPTPRLFAGHVAVLGRVHNRDIGFSGNGAHPEVCVGLIDPRRLGECPQIFQTPYRIRNLLGTVVNAPTGGLPMVVVYRLRCQHSSAPNFTTRSPHHKLKTAAPSTNSNRVQLIYSQARSITCR